LSCSDVDTGLIDSTLVGFAGQRLEVVGLRGIAEFLDVGVVDLQTELAEFALDVLVDLLLELITLSEDLTGQQLLYGANKGTLRWGMLTFFHCHRRDKHTSFTFNDTLNDVLDVLSATISLLGISVGEKHSVLHKRVAMVLWVGSRIGSLLEIHVLVSSITRSLTNFQTTLVDIGTDSEYDRKKELEFLFGIARD
jgi:hypothetical protein